MAHARPNRGGDVDEDKGGGEIRGGEYTIGLMQEGKRWKHVGLQNAWYLSSEEVFGM